MKCKVIWAALSGAITAVFLCSPSIAQIVRFDVPSEEAGKSLPELARQAGVQVIAPGDKLRGVITPEIKGVFDVNDALKLMLKGTGLVASRSPEGIVISLREPNKSEEREHMLNHKNSVSLLALILGAFTSAPALAQTDGQAASQPSVETVVVTGSRVISDVTDSPTPLTVVSTDDLARTTPTDLPDALNKLPTFQGSLTPRSAGGSFPMAGMNVLNLRNFGENRTLVLLDGHRVTPSNADGSVSVDTLPQILVSHVDVVTGGASAVYGSDAVTGVVNFVLDDKFDGLKLNTNAGISTYGDGANFKLEAAAGTDLFGGRGHIEVAVSHFQEDPVSMFARPYGPQIWVQTGTGTAANPFTTTENARRPTAPFGGRVTCTACTVNGDEFASNGILTPFVDGATTGTGNVSSGGDGGYSKYSTALNALRNNNLFSRFSYDIDPTTTFYIEGTAGEQWSQGFWFPIKIGPGATGTFFKNNPFLSPTVQSQLGNNGLSGATNEFSVGQFADAGPGELAGTRGENRMLSFTTGLDGVWGNYNWNLFYTHGENRQSMTSLFNQNYQHLFAAEDAVVGSNGTVQCYAATQAATAAEYANCTPMNPFGPTAITPAVMNYINGITAYEMTNTMDDFGGSIAGTVLDDWAGPIKAALSAEGRFNSLTITSNANPLATVNCTGLRLCNPSQALWAGAVLPMNASDNVWEVATEADVPLLRNAPLAQSLDIDLAGRFADYSVTGSVETWKIGIDYHVNDEVHFRGTTSIDIRAPNLYDLYQPTTSSFGGYFDEHTDTQGNVTQISGGNPNLNPEVARTYTFGAVYTPDFLPGFSSSLDYYQIRLHNAIGSVSGTQITTQQLCENAGGVGGYCSLYVRPLPFSNTTPANYPTTVYSQTLNTAVIQIQGFDYEASYGWDWYGHWAARLLANYQPVNEQQAYPGAPFTFTQVLPNNDLISKTHVTGFLSYSVEDWSIGLQDRWLGGYSKKTTSSPLLSQDYAQPHVHSVNYLDFNLQRDFSVGDAALTGYFTVQNVFNNQGNIYTTSSVQGIYYPTSPEDDIMGRYFTIGLRLKL